MYNFTDEDYRIMIEGALEGGMSVEAIKKALGVDAESIRKFDLLTSGKPLTIIGKAFLPSIHIGSNQG